MIKRILALVLLLFAAGAGPSFALPDILYTYAAGQGDKSEKNPSLAGFGGRALTLCVEKTDQKLNDMSVRDISDLYNERRVTLPDQKMPGFVRNACQRGLQDFFGELEFVKDIARWLDRNLKYLVRDQLVIRKDDGRTDVLLAPSSKELRQPTRFQARFKFGVDTDGHKIQENSLDGIITPSFKLNLNYEKVEFKLRLNPVRQTLNATFGLDHYLFGALRPNLEYKIRPHEDNRQIFEIGFLVKPVLPEVDVRMITQIVPERPSHNHFSGVGLVWKLDHWECWIAPSSCPNKSPHLPTGF
ncbi:MAG: hypothetical protein HYW89_01265 [Candidatus Sungiibacteriota bacterium]|uniref:Uncharacterized protein n=1 Tax=Candidatus Sungiibacteriota bacterium TaxID=2750080 RepID=A0A7T5RJX7_9BACT|nr:MAG: hypothetical protein HYW89_01265 [Candidatus Sungbacteria bacterium]